MEAIKAFKSHYSNLIMADLKSKCTIFFCTDRSNYIVNNLKKYYKNLIEYKKKALMLKLKLMQILPNEYINLFLKS